MGALSTSSYCLKILCVSMLIVKSKASELEACSRSTEFQLFADNSRAKGDIILSTYAQVLSICSHICLARKLCASFNYNSMAHDCEILSYNRISSEKEKLVSSPGWAFYQMATAKVCEY